MYTICTYVCTYISTYNINCTGCYAVIAFPVIRNLLVKQIRLLNQSLLDAFSDWSRLPNWFRQGPLLPMPELRLWTHTWHAASCEHSWLHIACGGGAVVGWCFGAHSIWQYTLIDCSVWCKTVTRNGKIRTYIRTCTHLHLQHVTCRTVLLSTVTDQLPKGNLGIACETILENITKHPLPNPLLNS